MKPTYALDFETFYAPHYSVSTLGPYAYTHHPEFDAYMVAVHEVVATGEVGFRYCGEPTGMDWGRLDGALLVAHNAGFDKAVFTRLQEQGTIPADLHVEWADTADLAAYLSAPRNLKGAAEQLLGVTPDKTVREEMRGISWAEAQRRGWRDRLIQYCAADAELCARLWQEFSDKWPEHEQRISRMTREMAEGGIYVDTEALRKARITLGGSIAEALQAIPWVADAAVGSTKAYNAQCAKEGLTAPASRDKNNPEYQAWAAQNAAAHPWITAVAENRSCNAMLEKLNTLQERLRPDGMADANTLLYCGAGTGRFTGSGGFNMQNLHKGEHHGVDMRGLFIPRPGHKFIISDLAQIEARVLLYLAGDKVQLEEIAKGTSVYEAHARATMGWTGGKLKEENPGLYALAKARVLGLGFGCGKDRFRELAKSMAGVELTPEEAARQVENYRRSNPKITSLWSTLDTRFHLCMGRNFRLALPSGRSILYRQVHPFFGKWQCMLQGRPIETYGGKLTENLVQATARDVFCEHLLAISDAGYAVRFHVHDEVIVEVPEEQAETAAAEIKAIMSTTPAWAPGLPLAAETFIADKYTK